MSASTTEKQGVKRAKATGNSEHHHTQTSGDGDDRFVVVTRTYPTTHGANRGRTYDKAHMIFQTDVEVSKKSFATYQEAVKHALEQRNDSCWFDGYEEEIKPHAPPWDSSEMGNCDNDEDQNIGVMKRSEYEAEQAQNELFVEKARQGEMFRSTLRDLLYVKQITKAGRVHYSHPPQAYDIKAEVEMNEETGQLSFPKGKDPSLVKSLYYTRDILKKKPSSKNGKDQNADPFLHTLAQCTSLQELIWHEDGCMEDHIEGCYVAELLDAAPHLQTTLERLSFDRCRLSPKAVEVLSRFRHLRWLEMPDAFNMMIGTERLIFGYDSESDGDDNSLPYDRPLLKCVSALSSLKRLDLGYSDGEMKQGMYDYCLSREALRKVQSVVRRKGNNGGCVTFYDTNMPQAWSSATEEEAARREALSEMKDDMELSRVLRELAKDELSNMSKK